MTDCSGTPFAFLRVRQKPITLPPSYIGGYYNVRRNVMPQFINTNIMSLNTVRVLDKSQQGLQTSMERLSSGMRINHARDDAAGMAISESMTSQINGMNQAVRNSNDGISMVQTADGALGGIAEKLQRIRELSVQSMNGSYSGSDRIALDNEVQGLLEEIDRVAAGVSFNGTNLLDGTKSTVGIQVGHKTTDQIDISLQNARLSSLGLSGAAATVTAAATSFTGNIAAGLTINSVDIGAVTTSGATTATGASNVLITAVNAKTADTGVTASLSTDGFVTLTSNSDIVISGTITNSGLTAATTTATGTTANVTTEANASTLVTSVDAALTKVNTARSKLGASQNRLEATVYDLKNNVENMSGARSRVQDADFAAETATLAKNQILQQAGMAMLSQANQLPQQVLKLLQ